MSILSIFERFGEGLDVVGVIVIVVGAIITTIFFFKNWFESKRDYTSYRQNFDRVILSNSIAVAVAKKDVKRGGERYGN